MVGNCYKRLKMLSNPKLLSGGKYTDERGNLSFFNSFDMKLVRRFYCIEHSDFQIIRAWQGHKNEQKWFCAVEGAFQIAIVQPVDWQRPSGSEMPQVFRLSADAPAVLHVPGGFATGFRAKVFNSKMLVFSDYTVEASKKDDYRFDKDIWKVDWGL